MSETDVPVYDGPARRAVKFLTDESEPVSLPGELNAVPSIVSNGDVFIMDGALVDDVLLPGRFEEVDMPDPDVSEAKSPNASLTKEELGQKLGLDEKVVDSTLKDDLVAQADEREPVFVPTPEPEGAPASGDDSTEDVQA